MNISGKLKYRHHDNHKRRMFITGKKYEYPIPKSTDYWEKVFDDEARKLIIVRNPFLELSYSKNNPDLVNLNSRVNDNTSNWNTSSKSYIDDRKTTENSLYKLSPARTKSKLKKNHFDDKESLSTRILTAPTPATSKLLDTTSNLSTASKIVRIPKLDTVGPQPSSGKILPGKVDRNRAPFNIQNKPKVPGESSSILPILGTFSTPPKPELTLNKIRQHLSLPEKKYFRINDQPRNKDSKVKNKKPSYKVDKIVEETRTKLTEAELKYSARFAYKALQRVTKNKNPNFKPKLIKHSLLELPFELNNSVLSDDEYQNLFNFESVEEHKEEQDLPFIGDAQEISDKNSVKDSEFTYINVQPDALESEETKSKTIPTTSRSTSGPSPQFVYPENFESPATRILASIPKLSSYPRKNCDRCLPCMYKSFEKPQERKISLPRTLLRKILHSENKKITLSRDSSENSISTSLSSLSFDGELEKSLNYDIETMNENCNDPTSQVHTKPLSDFQEKPKAVIEVLAQKTIPDTEPPRTTITKEAQEDQREDDIISKNLDQVTVSSTKASFSEVAKVSASFQSESSEEDDSNAISTSDDQSKPKFLVPCHAPTIFSPSMEPLKALKNRKPTTLQDRIAMLESTVLKKGGSIDDLDGVPEKSRAVPQEIVDKDKPSGKGKAVPPPLTKAKSDLEELTLEKAKVDTVKQQRVLKKGITVASFPLSTDTTSKRLEMHSDATKGVLKNVDAISHDNILKSIPEKNFPGAQSKLPLTDPKEVAEILKNLEENTSTMDMLEILCKEFSERLSKNVENNDSHMRDRIKMTITLIKLLVESKRYLYPDKFPSDLRFSTIQPSACNPKFLRHLLPLKTYNIVAPLLDMPEWYPTKKASFRTGLADLYSIPCNVSGKISSVHDSLEVDPPTPRDTESPDDEQKLGHRRYNPYGLFLTKPRRKVVTWRPLTKRDLEGYDPDATLETRAENMMKRICQNFCEWLDSLGGTDKTIDEEVLRDMFEIDFSAEACRAMQVLIQEMPVVPAEVARTRNCPGAGKLAMTRKHVMKDVKAEKKAPRTIAFGTTLPPHLRFVPPKNHVQHLWLDCENVPEDLETMDVVWKDLTHLKSVRGFVEWLQQSEVPPPEALKKLASMDIKALRQIEDDETFAHLELDIDQIQTLKIAVNEDAPL